MSDLSKYAITAWVGDEDGRQHAERVVQLKIAESVLEQAVLDGRIDELGSIPRARSHRAYIENRLVELKVELQGLSNKEKGNI